MLRIFIGHLIIILPYTVRNTVSVLHVFNWTLEDAATSMGATPIQVFFKITIPLARPASWPVRCWLFCIPLTRWP